jgi:hypothetical protein
MPGMKPRIPTSRKTTPASVASVWTFERSLVVAFRGPRLS